MPGRANPGSLAWREHWNGVYDRLRPTAVSWYQPHPTMPLEIIDGIGIEPDAAVLDAGGGASLLVDTLSGRGFTDLTVVDISRRALDVARGRCPRAERITWLEQDLLAWQPERHYDLWCDRAVFHFLTNPGDQSRYREVLRSATRPGGHVIMATFADDGPDSCSGLPVCRYGPDDLVDLFGNGFELIEARRELHLTPTGATQPFTWIAARVIS